VPAGHSASHDNAQKSDEEAGDATIVGVKSGCASSRRSVDTSSDRSDNEHGSNMSASNVDEDSSKKLPSKQFIFAKRKQKASSPTYDNSSNEDTPIAAVDDGSNFAYAGMATPIDELEPPMSRRGQDSKRSKASDKRKEIVKRKRAPVMDLTRPMVDNNQHSSAPVVVDLTEEHFDRAMEKIKREIDRRNDGSSPKKAGSKDKEMIKDELKKRHETSSQYSVHRFVVSDPGKLGLLTERGSKSPIMKIKMWTLIRLQCNMG
jgi:hypothetical protein